MGPATPAAEFEVVADLKNDGYYLRRFSLGEHTGTHINAPAAFHAEGITIDQYPASAFAASAVVIDVRAEAQANPDYLLRVDKLLEWERQHGPAPARSLLLLHTGWAKNGLTRRLIWGMPGTGQLHFPGFDVQALGMLLTQRASPASASTPPAWTAARTPPFPSTGARWNSPHRPGNLCNLDQLPPLGANVVIGALRLEGGSGSPASVLAFLP